MWYAIESLQGFSLIIITLSKASESKDKQLNIALTKRSLLEREREFFKSQPVSEDLRAFIERYKRKDAESREKRSQNIDENVYILQNGQLVPIRSIKGHKRSEDERKNDVEGFTVVPLVIPLISRQSENKLPKTRNLNEELTKSEAPVAAAPVAVSIDQPVTRKAESEPIAANDVSSVEEEGEDNNRTQEETQVLHKILEDVEGLMQWKHEGNKKEGVLCNLNGSWISDAAGMRFDICFKNSTRKKFKIHVADKIPPSEVGFLCDGNWTVFGELPFLHSGECRVCEGSETVTGTWLIGRSSRDCKDQNAAHKILSDVWKREQGHTLRKKHLQQLGYHNVNDED
ncbi:uncharacterized protein BDFB_004246 [Asbolus verrucosus]|uniref:Uncharacterized protein n=1 Tax=Asbolus verrucosus TaxID=1661398 RepID=A0A482VH19_ASBVE|nr:uncharacterized protein BDFB_004246 [Asbolus verrucosus]